MDKSYTISEVATKLNVADKTLRRWEDSGKFHSTRTLGNQRRYSIEDLQILDAIKHGIIESQSELLTITEAANLCGVSPSSIERWVKEGKIHPFITSGKTYFPKPRLLAKLDQLSTSNTPETIAVPISHSLPQANNATASSPPSPTTTPVSTKQPTIQPSSLEKPSSKKLSPQLTNFLITILLILSYHLTTTLFSPPTPNISPSNTAIDTTIQPTTVGDYFDSTGNLNTQGSLTSRQLNLLPTTPPPGNPGALYYDAGANSLRLFTDTWTDLASPPSTTTPLTTQDTTLIAGAGNLKKGADNILINNKHITPATPITITFTSDYSPAKKYWLEQAQGSFTLHTDFPVGQNSSFTYLILAPAINEPEVATSSPTVF